MSLRSSVDVFSLVAAEVLRGYFMDVRTVSFTRRNLPHWLVADRSHFVTIRLKGSLPSSVVSELQVEREKFMTEFADDSKSVSEFRQRQFEKIEFILDSCAVGVQPHSGCSTGGRAGATSLRSSGAGVQPHSGCSTGGRAGATSLRSLGAGEQSHSNCCTGMWMGIPEVADIVFDNLKWFESHGWRIDAACVMPTHLHVLMLNVEGRTGALRADLGQFKNYTARVANKILSRKGAFWAAEDFDHWCRSDDKVRSAIEYIRNNPVKAGLVDIRSDWKWIK